MAEEKLGDAIFANTIMLGFAWQKGLVPVSARALYRAINLNGVEAEANLQAFEIGRIAAYDPAQRRVETATPPAKLPQTDAAGRADRPPRRRARRLPEPGLRRALPASASPPCARPRRRWARETLTRAAAINLYKLMAIKDEYEVARLYSDGRFAAALGKTFTGGKAKVLLAPPMLVAEGRQGPAAQDGVRPLDAALGLPDAGQAEGPARRPARPLRPHGRAQGRAPRCSPTTKRRWTSWSPA